MLDDETLSLKTLDSSSSDSLPLLQAAAPRMLETLRSKRISGIFLILNTHDFTDRTSGDRLPCVYLRDLDPDAAPSVVNSDILFECAPSLPDCLRRRRAYGGGKLWPLDDSAV